MKKKLLLLVYAMTLLILIIAINGCNETTRSVQRIPPPPEATTPPKPIPTPTPTPAPKVVSVDTSAVPSPEPTPAPATKPKQVKRPAPAYVIINAPVGILGASKIDVFERADPKSKVIAKVSSGTKLQLITTQGIWMKIKTTEGRTGWISSSYRAR